MAQHRTVPARKDSGHEEAVPADVPVSNRVDAPMDHVQPAAPDPMPDCLGPEAENPKLRVLDHPVLLGGQIRHPPINCLVSTGYGTAIRRQLGHGATMPARP
jgi:hypothetical protein